MSYLYLTHSATSLPRVKRLANRAYPVCGVTNPVNDPPGSWSSAKGTLPWVNVTAAIDGRQRQSSRSPHPIIDDTNHARSFSIMVTRVSVSTRAVLHAPRVNTCSRLDTSPLTLEVTHTARTSPHVRNIPRHIPPNKGGCSNVDGKHNGRSGSQSPPNLSRSLCYRSCYGKPGVLTSTMQPLDVIGEMTLERGGRVPINQAWSLASVWRSRKKTAVINWFVLCIANSV